jgi:hypothetical protein
VGGESEGTASDQPTGTGRGAATSPPRPARASARGGAAAGIALNYPCVLAQVTVPDLTVDEARRTGRFSPWPRLQAWAGLLSHLRTPSVTLCPPSR